MFRQHIIMYTRAFMCARVCVCVDLPFFLLCRILIFLLFPVRVLECCLYKQSSVKQLIPSVHVYGLDVGKIANYQGR